MAVYDWLPWVNLVIIIILIILLVVGYFFGTGFITAANYNIIDLNGSDAMVDMPTGGNNMGISKPTALQTVTVQQNSNNIKGETFGISNTSSPADSINMTIQQGSGVSIDFGGAGDVIIGGELALFIATDNNNSFTRLQ